MSKIQVVLNSMGIVYRIPNIDLYKSTKGDARNNCVRHLRPKARRQVMKFVTKEADLYKYEG